MEEGLSRGLIKAVITDNIGFVWSATDEGIIRYDGRSSVLFKNSLPAGLAKAFCKTRDGQILALHDRGIMQIISKPDTTIFKKIAQSSYKDTDTSLYFPKTIYEDKKGQVWVGENQAVVCIQQGKLKKYRFTSEDLTYSLLKSFSFAEDSHGNLWTVSWNGNFYIFNEQQQQFERVTTEKKVSSVSCMIATINNSFWLGCEDGLYEIKTDASKRIVSNTKLSGIRNISTVLLVNNKEVYVGTWDKGLFKAAYQSRPLLFEPVKTLQLRDVNSLHYDPQHGVWVCDSENIGLLKPIFFDTLQLREKAPAITAMQLSTDSSVIFVNGENVYQIEKIGLKFRPKLLLINKNVYATTVAKKAADIWMGTFAGEVYHFNMDAQLLEKVKGIEPNNPITNIFLDTKSNIWICGNAKGLYRLDEAGKTIVYKQPSLQKTKMILEGSDGMLYCISDDPLHYLQLYDKSLDSFVNVSVKLPFKIPANFNIEDAAFLNKNKILLGTSVGILQHTFSSSSGYKIGHLERISLSRISIDEPIKAVRLGSAGRLWVVTTSGLILTQNDASSTFDRSSGLPSKNIPARGLAIDKEQILWTATNLGLAFFQENAERRETPAPIIKLLKVNGEKINAADRTNAQFPYKSYLEVDFACLSYPADRLKYQTRIIGLDTNWTNTEKTEFMIPSLPAGNYIFQVRSLQYGGFLWSKPNSYSFTINTPWFTSWWAILLFTIVLFLLIVGAVRIYNWSLIKKNERLEKIIAERTQEIKRQKNELIENKNQIIAQKEELIKQNQAIFETKEALSQIEIKNKELQEAQLKKELEFKNKQITMISLKIIEKNKMLSELKTKMQKLHQTASSKLQPEIHQFIKIIDQSFRHEDDWEEFKLCFEQVNVDFYRKLNEAFPNLTTLEQRHCALIKLNLTIKEAASVLGVSPESVKIFRLRLRNKLQIESQKELVEYIVNL
jgi:ligand-binding sensor domain-containing protein/DNA-binding CsgD family transcriptional regulator